MSKGRRESGVFVLFPGQPKRGPEGSGDPPEGADAGPAPKQFSLVGEAPLHCLAIRGAGQTQHRPHPQPGQAASSPCPWSGTCLVGPLIPFGTQGAQGF